MDGILREAKKTERSAARLLADGANYAMRFLGCLLILAHAVWKGPTEIMVGFGLPHGRVGRDLASLSSLVPVGDSISGVSCRCAHRKIRAAGLFQILTAGRCRDQRVARSPCTESRCLGPFVLGMAIVCRSSRLCREFPECVELGLPAPAKQQTGTPRLFHGPGRRVDISISRQVASSGSFF